MSLILGIDYGGSFIKAGAVECDTGQLVGELASVATPPGASLAGSKLAVQNLAARFPDCVGPVGLAFPSVVRHGVTHTAAHISPEWIDVDAVKWLSEALGRPGYVLNDADAAGLAEIRIGAGQGERGKVMMVTFGTGIGTALFLDGKLWPNTELGHLHVGAEEAEVQASARTRAQQDLDWPTWCARVNTVLLEYHRLLWPDLFIVGGGVSERWEEFQGLITPTLQVVPARLRQSAGVVGAALYAREQSVK
jgi:polyphosphate glucokinase